MARDHRQSGFSLVELMIVVAVLAALVAAVGTSAHVVNSTLNTNGVRADVTASAQRSIRMMGTFARSGKLSTIQVQAVAADVAALRATYVGEWIPPSDLVWRPGIEFVCAAGVLKINASLNTAQRRLTFELDPGEIANGADDDGDGLIDEGSVILKHDLSTVAVVHDVEDCSFMLDGRLLSIRLRCGKRDASGRVHRATFERAFYMRNN